VFVLQKLGEPDARMLQTLQGLSGALLLLTAADPPAPPARLPASTPGSGSPPGRTLADGPNQRAPCTYFHPAAEVLLEMAGSTTGEEEPDKRAMDLKHGMWACSQLFNNAKSSAAKRLFLFTADLDPLASCGNPRYMLSQLLGQAQALQDVKVGRWQVTALLPRGRVG
jgi:hypothetical protein